MAATHFVFVATEATLLDTPSCLSEVAEVHSSILFDLLVVLAMVFGAVAPGSPLRRQRLVGEMALTGAAIGSQRS